MEQLTVCSEGNWLCAGRMWQKESNHNLECLLQKSNPECMAAWIKEAVVEICSLLILRYLLGA